MLFKIMTPKVPRKQELGFVRFISVAIFVNVALIFELYRTYFHRLAPSVSMAKRPNR